MTTTTGEIAAFMAEPILGVGGFIVPPPGYFERAVEITRKHGGLFIADEVQTAWGRTGDKWFGIEHWDVEPDIITSAKGLGNGVPIGITVATPRSEKSGLDTCLPPSGVATVIPIGTPLQSLCRRDDVGLDRPSVQCRTTYLRCVPRQFALRPQ